MNNNNVYDDHDQVINCVNKKRGMLQPIEIERNELGYQLDEVREGRYVRVFQRRCPGISTSMFLIHGGGGRAGQFKHLVKVLQSKVNVVAFDFLGHGDSPSPNQPELYTIDEHLKDLSVIYDKYKGRRNVLLGHCYGGVHALRLVKQLNDQGRVNELVGVVILCLGDKCLPGTMLGYLPAPVLEVLRPLARSSSNAALFTPTTDPAIVAFENAISDRNRMYMMKVLLGDTTNQELWNDYITTAAQVLISKDIPRLLIGGEGDGIFPEEKIIGLKRILEVPDDCYHVINEVGHLPMLEKPSEVLDIILNFI